MANIMTYDYAGDWQNKTGHHTLFMNKYSQWSVVSLLFSNLNFITSKLNFKFQKGTIDRWINGPFSRKINLGLAFYGRSFKLKYPNLYNKIGAPAKIGEGPQGPYTRSNGSMTFNEICSMIKKENMTIVRDEYVNAPYATIEDKWIGYDDEKSISFKTKFAYENNLAGVMAWSIEDDDFTGNCYKVKYPLINAINKVFFNLERSQLKATTNLPERIEDESHDDNNDDGEDDDEEIEVTQTAIYDSIKLVPPYALAVTDDEKITEKSNSNIGFVITSKQKNQTFTSSQPSNIIVEFKITEFDYDSKGNFNLTSGSITLVSLVIVLISMTVISIALIYTLKRSLSILKGKYSNNSPIYATV